MKQTNIDSLFGKGDQQLMNKESKYLSTLFINIEELSVHLSSVTLFIDEYEQLKENAIKSKNGKCLKLGNTLYFTNNNYATKLYNSLLELGFNGSNSFSSGEQTYVISLTGGNATLTTVKTHYGDVKYHYKHEKLPVKKIVNDFWLSEQEYVYTNSIKLAYALLDLYKTMGYSTLNTIK